jgi:hypothetical protein
MPIVVAAELVTATGSGDTRVPTVRYPHAGVSATAAPEAATASVAGPIRALQRAGILRDGHDAAATPATVHGAGATRQRQGIGESRREPIRAAGTVRLRARGQPATGTGNTATTVHRRTRHALPGATRTPSIAR